MEYLDWTERVIAGCRGVDDNLEQHYDLILVEGRKILSRGVATVADQTPPARAEMKASPGGHSPLATSPEYPKYFSDWGTKGYACSCGWVGTGTELSIDFFDRGTLIEASCPKCDSHLAIVLCPTDDETRAAAAAGNEEAKRMLPQVKEGEAWRERYEREKLHHPSQLPDVEGARLQFIIEVEGPTLESYYIIKLGEQIVWREPAGWEDWERFNELKVLLKRRYRSRWNLQEDSCRGWSSHHTRSHEGRPTRGELGTGRYDHLCDGR